MTLWLPPLPDTGNASFTISSWVAAVCVEDHLCVLAFHGGSVINLKIARMVCPGAGRALLKRINVAAKNFFLQTQSEVAL
jgi:hypothetical protein